jgi:23S rRNA (guanosine2251-2'-O)-methyltransferase
VAPPLKQSLGGDVVPGRRAVRELLLAGHRPVRSLFVARDRDASPIVEEILDLAADAGVSVRLVDASRVAREAHVETHQGIVAIAAPVAAVSLETLFAAAAAFIVAVDGVTDPQNLGAILRTAEVAGATGAVLPRHRSALLTPAAVKAAAGATEYLPLALVAGIPGALEDAARAGVWSVGLDGAGTTSVFELPVADAPVVLVLGAEGRGLSRLARERCDLLATIPMHGHLESLNVAAATAVACFEVARRRRE